MDAQMISVLANMGFPAILCVILIWKGAGVLNNNTNAMNNNTEAVNNMTKTVDNQTQAINHLTDLTRAIYQKDVSKI